MTIQIKLTQKQADFCQLNCRYPAFVGGYGSGKTEALIASALMDASKHPDALIALYAPTYDLVKLIIAPRLIALLSQHGLFPPNGYNKQDNMITTNHPGFGRFILRSLDNPARIVGYETFRAHIDELDTLNMQSAKDVWDKVIARNRQKIPGETNKVSVYTTPEGFRFVYQRWEKHKNPDYQYVRTPSYSNPELPADYIESLRNTYTDELAQAYIEGYFVNLTSGTVYSSYDRAVNNSSEVIRPGDTLHIGCDFNVTKQAATVFIQRGNVYHAVEELVDMFDTPGMIEVIKGKYPNHKVIMYPDATGGSRKTTDASVSDISLLYKAGFSVRAPKKNPPVRDRVIATNVAFSKGKICVNHRKCPTVAECLEQQAYNKNGEPDKTSGFDHQNDATTYFIHYTLPIRKPISDMAFTFNV